MPKLDKELIELVKQIGAAVKGLPQAVQADAFEILVRHHLASTSSQPSGGIAPPSMRQPSEAGGAEWAATLASEARVTEEQIQSILHRDEEGFYPVHADLGGTDAERTRNIAILVLWATRVVTRDIYAPQAVVYRAVRALKLSSKNLTNSLKPEETIRSVTVSGQKMFQLVGDWRGRAAEVISHYAS